MADGCAGEEDKALQDAERAATAGDARAMAVALHNSYALDGLKRRLHQYFPYLKPDQVDGVISESVDSLYQAITRGEHISNLMGYIWKVCARIGSKVNYMNSIVRATDADLLVAHSDVNTARQYAQEHDDDDPDEQRRTRALALALARSLLPEIGHVNAQAVMTYLIDAVEAGREDVPSTEIADALGLTSENVRQLRYRGFVRLERAARVRGIVPDGLNIPMEDGDNGDLSNDD